MTWEPEGPEAVFPEEGVPEEEEDEEEDEEAEEEEPPAAAFSTAVRVFFPATPSALRLWAFWKASTAEKVILPYFPSAEPFMYPWAISACCSALTREPVAPNRRVV